MRVFLFCLAFFAAVVLSDYEGACGNTKWYISSSNTQLATVWPNEGATDPTFDCDICRESRWGSSLRNVVFQSGVVGIGADVFQRCQFSVVNITIPDTLVNIGEKAFGGCAILEYITVDSNNPAFTAENNVLYNKDKTKLIYHPAQQQSANQKVEIANTVTSIADFAFANCSYVNISIPSSVTSIGQGVFADCKKLQNLFIDGDNFKFEDNFLTGKDGKVLYAYPVLSSVTSLKIPDSVETVLGYTFYNNGKITSLNLNKAEFIGPYAFFNNNAINGELEIPDSVTYVGPYAFAKCQQITSVKIGDGLTFIENYTFLANNRLASVELGKEIESVAPLAFESCPVLVYEEYENGLYLGTKSNKHLILYKAKNSDITSCKVHDDTKRIAASSFKGLSKLTTLTISDSVKVIEDFAFENCGLTTLTLGSGIENISQYAFNRLKLTEKTLTIPDSVRWIGTNAFYADSQCQVTSLKIGKNVKHIGDYGFAYFKKVTDLEIPDSVEEIGIYAFYSYDVLKSVKIGKGVKSIGFGVFVGNVALETIKVDSDNSYFKSVDNVLYDKDGKTLIVCPAKKTSVNIEKTVTTLDSYSFFNCQYLKKLALPKSVTSIGKNAFSWALELEAFTVEEGNPAFKAKNGYLMTKNGTVLVEVPKGKKLIKVPDSVTMIPGYAFERSQATSVYVGDNVDSIGSWAFNYMSALKEVSLGSGITSWSTNVFSSVNSLTKLCYFGKTNPGVKVFNGVNSLKSVTVPNDYTGTSFCNKNIVKADTCTVDAEEESSESDESYDSEISGSSEPGAAQIVIPSNMVIAIAACIASAMLFLF